MGHDYDVTIQFQIKSKIAIPVAMDLEKELVGRFPIEGIEEMFLVQGLVTDPVVILDSRKTMVFTDIEIVAELVEKIAERYETLALVEYRENGFDEDDQGAFAFGGPANANMLHDDMSAIAALIENKLDDQQMGELGFIPSEMLDQMTLLAHNIRIFYNQKAKFPIDPLLVDGWVLE